MCPPRVSAISVGRFLDIGGRDSENEVGGFGKTPRVPTFGDFPLALPCLCHETLQACDQWMAEPSRQKHLCQQHESSLWHSSHKPEAHVLLENFDLLMHTLEMLTHQRLSDCHQTVQKFWVICWSTHCVHPSRHHSHQCTSQHHPHSILRHHTH